jgi:Rad3-related DNA helicase
LDSRSFSFANRLKEGSEAHRMLQAAYAPGDLREVPLAGAYEGNGVRILVSGRADGILDAEGDCAIEEIKSSQMRASSISEPLLSHTAQAAVYAHLYCEKTGRPSIRVRVKYYSTADGESAVFEERYSASSLKERFDSLCSAVAILVRAKADRASLRDAAIARLQFPFPFRKGQKRLIRALQKAQSECKSLFLTSPTGSGKTLSALYASLPSLVGEQNAKIVYLTAKSPQRGPAIETLKLMEKTGLDVFAVALTAKEKCCLQEKCDCFPESCEYARGYFEKSSRATLAAIRGARILGPADIAQMAENYKACPFELSLDLARWADVIIGDYNYFFDPFARLAFLTGKKAQNALLVDEAHNLLSRSREMYSARLERAAALMAKKASKGAPERLWHVNRILRRFSEAKKECSEMALGKLAESLETFVGHMADAGAADGGDLEPMEALFVQARRFLALFAIRCPSHTMLFEEGKGGGALCLFCSDAKGYLAESRKAARSAVFFSATMEPLAFYCEMLGGKRDDYLLASPPVFDPGNFAVICDLSIATEWRKRKLHYSAIAERIASAAKACPGNAIAFFPSYDFMGEVFAEYASACPGAQVLVQPRGMPEREREAFLAQFQEGGRLLAFAVSGGVFSEALDLTGNRLACVIVVGIALPKVSARQEAIRCHFNSLGADGFAYAYIYPGIAKTLQAMGRVIRTKTDRGAALLLDERFGRDEYRAPLLSAYGQAVFVHSGDECRKALEKAPAFADIVGEESPAPLQQADSIAGQ